MNVSSSIISRLLVVSTYLNKSCKMQPKFGIILLELTGSRGGRDDAYAPKGSITQKVGRFFIVVS